MVHTHDAVHSEFQLGLDKFVSNTNVVRPNSIFTKDQRLRVWEDPVVQDFVDYQKRDSWVGNQPKVRVRNATTDFETV